MNNFRRSSKRHAHGRGPALAWLSASLPPCQAMESLSRDAPSASHTPDILNLPWA
ncbi:hypothetical protein GCWU000182_01941 [Abiotrophia defectiva ATCC 49176]|uniref:Uncharacterized protein n=1 Tax=Abiotrophia defectiva ATCC 49176 TaxID=592010 RepID=W1Q4C3_ABIDE|nr:hypothetical protein GCWU000182_01941 [Abiotrophia defectiva ATCC 49176]